jgi:NAD-dependent dihydropyrimidine dehydrogenase PreA subunit
MREKIFIDPLRCKGCQICIDSCPVDVLRPDPETGRAFAAYPTDCQTCFLCQDDCPEQAIRIDPEVINPRTISVYDAYGIALRPIEGDDWK